MSFLKHLPFLKKKNKKKRLTHDQLDAILDSYRYEICQDPELCKKPKIESPEKTIELLATTSHSICRFGDAELELIEGKSVPYQTFSPELSKRLSEILSSNKNNIYIAINSLIYAPKFDLFEAIRTFWRKHGKHYREVTEKHINITGQYYDANITALNTLYENYDLEQYFQSLREIWDQKNLVIVAGKNVFENITHNIYDNAASIEHIHVGSRNAFDDYTSIYAQCKNFSQDKLFIIMAGPTATVLAYDLACEGYRALDLGHAAKSWDWYKKGISFDKKETAHRFFAPS